jgi:hypothetical protein
MQIKHDSQQTLTLQVVVGTYLGYGEGVPTLPWGRRHQGDAAWWLAMPEASTPAMTVVRWICTARLKHKSAPAWARHTLALQI